MLIYASMGTTVLVLKNNMYDYIDNSCTNEAGTFYEIDQIYKNGDTILCSTSCPCAADETDWPLETQVEMVTDSLGSKELSECPNDGMTYDQKDKYYDLINRLEDKYNCAGICYNPTYFQFSDVSKGPTSNDCQDELTQLFEEHAVKYGVLMICVGVIGLIGFGTSFAICYLKRKGLPSNFYKHEKYGLAE